MKLIDLHPRFADAGGSGILQSDGTPAPERKGVGLLCDCPCGCGSQMYVPFANPLDGGPQFEPGRSKWLRVGETFEVLTLAPSIKRIPHDGSCGWHGFITNGETRTESDSLPATPEFVQRMREEGIELEEMR